MWSSRNLPHVVADAATVLLERWDRFTGISAAAVQGTIADEARHREARRRLLGTHRRVPRDRDTLDQRNDEVRKDRSDCADEDPGPRDIKAAPAHGTQDNVAEHIRRAAEVLADEGTDEGQCRAD